MNKKRWHLIHGADGFIHSPYNFPHPRSRDIWGGSAVYKGNFYIFGGAGYIYGSAHHPDDLSSLGVLNDFWKFDPQKERWELLMENNNPLDYSCKTMQPGGRVLPITEVVGDKMYLFGGISILSSGWRTRGLNDMWCYDFKSEKWEIIEPDDASDEAINVSKRANRPSHLAAAGSVAIDKNIYIFGGWHVGTPLIITNAIWRYNVVNRKWALLREPLDKLSEQQFPRRYCLGTCIWQDKIYIFGGLDTTLHPAKFYNDMWVYYYNKDKLEIVSKNEPGAKDKPCPLYAFGSSVMKDSLYIFGGFNGVRELSHFWRYHFILGKWEEIIPDTNRQDYSERAILPGIRRAPAMDSLDTSLILFGGISLRTGIDNKGPSVDLNDIWIYR